jgi:hypothetical protein
MMEQTMEPMMDALREEMKANQDGLPAKENGGLARKDRWHRFRGKSEEIELKARHEVPKEEAAVKIVRELKKRHGYWHIAVRHHGQLKKQTQGDGGSRKKLAAACRGMAHCDIRALCKGTQSSGTRKGQCCTRNPERMDTREEMSGETGMQQ